MYPLLVQAVVVTIASAVAWGATRFRTPADVAIVILAAAALDAAVDSWRAHRAGVPSEGPATTPPPAAPLRVPVDGRTVAAETTTP